MFTITNLCIHVNLYQDISKRLAAIYLTMTALGPSLDRHNSQTGSPLHEKFF